MMIFTCVSSSRTQSMSKSHILVSMHSFSLKISEAEYDYEALILGLKVLEELGSKGIVVLGESLLACQYKCHDRQIPVGFFSIESDSRFRQ